MSLVPSSLRVAAPRTLHLAVALALAACASADDTSKAPVATVAPTQPPPPTGEAPPPAPPPARTPRPDATFLDASEYADLLTIDAAFPFGVARRYEADRSVGGSRWGRHAGPMVTTSGEGRAAVVVRWELPAVPTGSATRTERPLTRADGVPRSFFYGVDGVVDLPFGPYALLTYSGQGATFPGEALVYTADYDAVVGRAHVNGFYSGVGVTEGGAPLLVYSGLSPLAAAATTTNECGLYAGVLCADALAQGRACPNAVRVFGWSGGSGPVARDPRGNVFVAASLTEAATSDAVYGLSRSVLAAPSPREPRAILTVDSLGTSSLAAASPYDDERGWIVGKGYDAATPFYAAAYVDRGDAVEASGPPNLAAMTPGKAAQNVTAFADDEGDLWLAVTTDKTGYFLELRSKK